jgi:hypothetical protein
MPVNDPFFVGDLVSRIKLGEDVTEDLQAGLRDGKISHQTYIDFRGQSSSKAFQLGLSYIEDALKPSPAEKWNPDVHLRYADAALEFSMRTSKGQPPVDVARDIVDRYTDHIKRTIIGLPVPRFLSGDKRNVSDLREAQRKTAEAFLNNQLSKEEYKLEMDNLGMLIDLVTKNPKTAVPQISKDRFDEIKEKNK